MAQGINSELERTMTEATEAAMEMSALLREAESSRKEAEALIKQLKAGSSPKVQAYLKGERPLNEDEQARMAKIQKVFKEEVGDLEGSRKVVEAINKDLERMNIGELTRKGRRRIVI
mgnify:CR=1 FL=1